MIKSSQRPRTKDTHFS